MLVQDSAGVPPQLELIIPIGTCNFLNNSLAKKYADALKFLVSSGLETFQLPLTSPKGFIEICFSTLNILIFEFDDFAISSSALLMMSFGGQPINVISILD